MAARIETASLQSDPMIKVHAKDFEKKVHGLFALCPDPKCRCRLSAVGLTSRNVNGEQIQVDPFFRLFPNAEKTGHGHKDRCRFNVKGSVERIVAHSKEIRNFTSAELLVDRTRN